LERDPRESQQFFVHLDDGTAYFVTWTPAGETGTMRFAAGDPDFDTWCNRPQDFTFKTIDLLAHGAEGWAQKQIGPRHAAHLIERIEARCNAAEAAGGIEIDPITTALIEKPRRLDARPGGNGVA
jgi:hypothetical protein